MTYSTRSAVRAARGWAAVGSVAVLLGCASASPSRYVSPRLTGQVLDRESRAPLKGVRVRRLTADGLARSSAPPAGGQLMESAAAVQTGADGRFVMKSARVLGLMGASGWYSVTVAFERSGYQTLVQSYTLNNSTNAPSGEPVVDAGEVLIRKVGGENGETPATQSKQ